MKAKRLLPFLAAAAIGASALTGCGSTMDTEAAGATLDGEKISLGFMNFMAKYQQAMYDGYYSEYFGADMWSQDLYGNGTDMETSVKEQVAENVEVLYLLEDHMDDYGVELTEEELTAIEKAAKAFMSDNSKEAIAQIGATEEYVKEMLRYNTIQKKMRDSMDQEVDANVSDAEAAQKTFSYVKVSKTTTVDAEGKSVEYTEEEKTALAESIQEFAATAQGNLDEAAKTAGYTVSKQSYGIEESAFAEEVIAAVDKLQDGQMTSLIETADDYYVARMDTIFDQEATTAKKEEILTKRKTDHYTEVVEGYKKDVSYKVNEKEWKKVKFDDLFTIKAEEDSENTDEK